MTGHDPQGNDPVDAPFSDLVVPIERHEPRPSFARELRDRIVAALELDERPPPTMSLPERKLMNTTAVPPTPTATITPYLTSADGAAAIDWYSTAFGATEEFRVVGDDGRIGHAELTIAGARFMLSDEYPDMGVRSPRSLGGAGAAFHLDVEDVDTLFARAVSAGATSLQEPADQPHGARHGTLVDPDGHRWMLSQQMVELTVDDYADRAEGSGFSVVKAEVPGAVPEHEVTTADRAGRGGGIWAAVFYDDALAGIRFLADTFGFEEQLVVVGDDGTSVVHSQLRWPEGGIVQAGTYADHHGPDDPFVHPPGAQSLYVVTADPRPVWDRCVAAGVEVIREPNAPDYDPDGMGFAVRDPEGNVWTFGTYGLGADA